jgi:hypothetical protein
MDSTNRAKQPEDDDNDKNVDYPLPDSMWDEDEDGGRTVQTRDGLIAHQRGDGVLEILASEWKRVYGDNDENDW